MSTINDIHLFHIDHIAFEHKYDSNIRLGHGFKQARIVIVFEISNELSEKKKHWYYVTVRKFNLVGGKHTKRKTVRRIVREKEREKARIYRIKS